MGIENPTKRQIQEMLAQIGWSIRHHGCEHYYFYNHKNKRTDLMLVYPDTDSRIESVPSRKNSPMIIFYMKDLVMEIFGGHDDKPNDAVSFKGIHDNNIFILCMNHSEKIKPYPLPSPTEA